MSILKEFKQFAIRGNVIDMAIGIVIGGAFGKIVSSLVSDIIMPPIGKLLGGVNFADLFVVLGSGEYASIDAAKKAGVATLNYGLFINTVVDFVIVATAMFLVMKAMNAAKRKEEAKPTPPPPTPAAEERLLTEIRDLLKSQAR